MEYGDPNHAGDRDAEDPNAAPVQSKVAVGKKVKFRPHEQVEAAIPQYLQPSDPVILARDASKIEGLRKAQVTKVHLLD